MRRMRSHWAPLARQLCASPPAVAVRNGGRPLRVLGIETSCDDTSVAVVAQERPGALGRIESLAAKSQLEWHNRLGGILPTEAERLHTEAIDSVVSDCVTGWHGAGDFWHGVDAVAATVEPGLTRSLRVGAAKALALCRRHRKPFVPVHHMRAHALTARMGHEHLDYPFLCLLISGGHCLLALAEAHDNFTLLGTAPDVAPGDALDKAARSMALGYLRREYQSLSGGRAIELLAAEARTLYTGAEHGGRSRGAHVDYRFGMKQIGKRDCDFSFAGLRYAVDRHVGRIEAATVEFSAGRLTELRFLAASVQYYVLVQLARKSQRAMELLEFGDPSTISASIVPDMPAASRRRLVVSGGVARNGYVCAGLRLMAAELSRRAKLDSPWTVHVPEPALCSDNGAMIAWNAVEMLRADSPAVIPFAELPAEYPVRGKSPIGADRSAAVVALNWKMKDPIRLGYRVGEVID